MQKNTSHFWEAEWLILEQPGVGFGCQCTIRDCNAVVCIKFPEQAGEALVKVCEGKSLALGGDLHTNVRTVQSVYIEVYIDLRGTENDILVP